MDMQLVDPSLECTKPILEYEAVRATALALGAGTGAAHIYLLSFEPGGQIGPHVAAFGQLLIPVTGSGWAAGSDGVRFLLTTSQAAYWGRGELHSKGSEAGMTALMIQVRDLTIEAQEGRA